MKILFLILSLLFISNASAAGIEIKLVNVGGVDAVFISPPKPRASIILLTGGTGYMRFTPEGDVVQGKGNQLVRTREDYAKRGFAVLVPNVGYNLAQLVEYMRGIKSPVTVAGTSRGTQRAAEGIANGARPDKLVLTSGFLSNDSGDNQNVMNILQNPALLPRTLVVHHRQDGCHKTTPGGVEPFIKWSAGKARVVWLDGGENDDDPCEAYAYHGFNEIDGQVVSVISGFAGK